MLENLAGVTDSGALNGQKFESELRQMRSGGLLHHPVDLVG